MKVCTGCKINKSFSRYHKKKGTCDGLRHACKECTNADNRKRWSSNKAAYNITSKEWAAANKETKKKSCKNWVENNREKYNGYHSKYRQNNPKKVKARMIVKDAIRHGTMTRQQCKIFDCFDIGEAHHEDYRKPLDVEWLCTKHHKQLHKENLV